MRGLWDFSFVKRSKVAAELLAMDPTLAADFYIRPWLSSGTRRTSRSTGTLNGILVSFIIPSVFFTRTL